MWQSQDHKYILNLKQDILGNGAGSGKNANISKYNTKIPSVLRKHQVVPHPVFCDELMPNSNIL